MCCQYTQARTHTRMCVTQDPWVTNRMVGFVKKLRIMFCEPDSDAIAVAIK